MSSHPVELVPDPGFRLLFAGTSWHLTVHRYPASGNLALTLYDAHAVGPGATLTTDHPEAVPDTHVLLSEWAVRQYAALTLHTAGILGQATSLDLPLFELRVPPPATLPSRGAVKEAHQAAWARLMTMARELDAGWQR